jgi:succinate-acetate transporter protein
MKLANPAPLGSFGFALATWLLGMIQANLLPVASTPAVVAMAFADGGSAQFAAALMAMAKGNSFNFIANCSIGPFWWSFALLTVFFSAGVPQVALGWYLIVWGAFSTAMLVASLPIDRATFLLFLVLAAALFVLGVAHLQNSPLLAVWGAMAILSQRSLLFIKQPPRSLTRCMAASSFHSAHAKYLRVSHE